MDIYRVRRLREQYEAILDDAEAARATYHSALKELYRSGVPLRDLAEQLGMSHQRVHQIVGEKAPPSKKRLVGAVSAVTLAAVAVFAAALWLEPSSDGTPSGRSRTVAVEVLTKGGSWHFEYPHHGGVSVSDGSPAIVLPTGTRIRLTLRSADVIHAMWIPRLAGKHQIIPGRTNRLFLNSAPIGTYTGMDAEFAGITHALPQFKIRVVPPAQFERWLADLRSDQPQRGQRGMESSRLATYARISVLSP